ncbi:hypothetical protein B9Z19DRAFT_1097062 [Tuber borchii]|uniref:Uncharacterized protein n=1 Tax=Tuber borchii TaxID=42251 RepID=A0A2T6ZAN7_TUBBO|nr:hypothetical protein B9Z19DRAFT_1097062 [Tuber borchii]
MSYTSSQRSAVQQFIAFTACPERTAAKVPIYHSPLSPIPPSPPYLQVRAWPGPSMMEHKNQKGKG